MRSTDRGDRSDRLGAFAVGVFGAAPELLAGVFAGLGGAEGHLAAALRAGGDLGQICLIRRIGLIFFSAVGQAGGGELFAVAAVFDEGFFESGNLPIEQEVRLVNQADEGISADGGVRVVKPADIEGVAFVVGEIGQIGRI